jgi:hypothetical protein
MALHGDYVTKIKEQKNRLKESDPNDWDGPQCFEERLLFCSGLIKCADISNVVSVFLLYILREKHLTFYIRLDPSHALLNGPKF